MIERTTLFKRREFFIFLAVLCAVFTISVSLYYYQYIQFLSKTPKILTCKVQNQYKKSSNAHQYYILKLKSKNGIVFYTSKGTYIGKILGDYVTVRVMPKHLTFMQYLGGFYARVKIIGIKADNSFKQKLNYAIAAQHTNPNIATIYEAMFTAHVQNRALRQKLSALGISHLLAISGFHLGVLSAVLFFLIGIVYKPLHNRFFPYRHANRDIFILVAFFLFLYVWFLGFTPSLIRSFFMLLIGYFLYDRGIEVVSMQTLFLTVVILIAFYPILLFSLGFWLSVAGVFYIFLFLRYFKSLKRWYIFFLLPPFVYLMMLPYSIYFFHIFSVYNPLSVVWTELFTIFYPISIIAHLLGFGAVFDNLLVKLLALGADYKTIFLSSYLFYLHVTLSLLAVRFKIFFYCLNLSALLFFVYCIKYVT